MHRQYEFYEGISLCGDSFNPGSVRVAREMHRPGNYSGDEPTVKNRASTGQIFFGLEKWIFKKM